MCWKWKNKDHAYISSCIRYIKEINEMTTENFIAVVMQQKPMYYKYIIENKLSINNLFLKKHNIKLNDLEVAFNLIGEKNNNIEDFIIIFNINRPIKLYKKQNNKYVLKWNFNTQMKPIKEHFYLDIENGFKNNILLNKSYLINFINYSIKEIYDIFSKSENNYILFSDKNEKVYNFTVTATKIVVGNINNETIIYNKIIQNFSKEILEEIFERMDDWENNIITCSSCGKKFSINKEDVCGNIYGNRFCTECTKKELI